MKFQISYPINPFNIVQGFGVNGAYYQANGINILGHNGEDLQAYHGQPVYAAHDGIGYYEVDDHQGHGVVIRTNQPYDYKGQQVYFKSIYWHFVNPLTEPKYKSPVPTDGSPFMVKKGDLIGYADSTGLSTGDHLHFGLKPVITGKAPTYGDTPDVGIGDFVNVEPNNGYLGAIDPAPYYDGNFAHNPTPPMQASAAQVQQVINQVRGVVENNPTPAQISIASKLLSVLSQLIKLPSWWVKDIFS